MAVGGQVSNVAEDFMFVQAKVLNAKMAGLSPDSFGFDDFNWAVAIVLSRAFYADNGESVTGRPRHHERAAGL